MSLFRNAIGHLASCQDVSQLLSQAHERPLGTWAQAKVRWHLAVCSMCRAFEKQLRFLDEALRRYRR